MPEELRIWALRSVVRVILFLAVKKGAERAGASSTGKHTLGLLSWIAIRIKMTTRSGMTPYRRFQITGINKNGRDAHCLPNCLSQLTVACLGRIQWA